VIDHDPAIRGGRPKIAGTGVAVARVAAWYKMGMTPEEIATQYGHLSLAQVQAALAYYHANTEEIEGDLAQEEAFAESVERGSEPRLPQWVGFDFTSTRMQCRTRSSSPCAPAALTF
jgi:uncharacterized protein (DUF433 family)